MIDAVGHPRSVLLLGGTSDIGVAVVRAWAERVPGLDVHLAARPSAHREAIATGLCERGCTVSVADFDARDTDRHAALIDGLAGDIDVAIVAFGVLGEPERAWTDVDHARELAEVNYVAAVTVGVALAGRIQRQGHGLVVALSSVAGERPRRSNFVYGSTKAGMDAFYTGLGEALRPHGGRVLVVRPGFVHSAMTAGLDPAPLATTPDAVAAAVVEAVAAGAEQVWVPGPLRVVMSGLRHLPRSIFRRLPV